MPTIALSSITPNTQALDLDSADIAIHRGALARIRLANEGDEQVLSMHSVSASLRAPSIANILGLIGEVAPGGQHAVSSELHAQLASLFAEDVQQQTRPHRLTQCQLLRIFALVSASVTGCLTLISLVIHNRYRSEARDEASPAVQADLLAKADATYDKGSIIYGVFLFSLAISIFLEIQFYCANQQQPDEENQFNAGDPLIPNDIELVDLNRHWENTHANQFITPLVKLFGGLKNVISSPIDKEVVKARIQTTLDRLCEVDVNFKAEMIAVAPQGDANDDRSRLRNVKEKILKAVNFMFSADQADKRPMYYPGGIKVGEVLTYVWTCIEKLSADGHEDKARLLLENLMKALYDASGYCNTGHVTRVLQAFKQSMQADSDISSVLMTAQDFYTLHQNDLYQLVTDVIRTPTIRANLHALAQSQGEGSQAYKAAATQLIKNNFLSKLNAYLVASHPQVLTGNADFTTELMAYLDPGFAFFIDNARDNNDDDAGSVASFAWNV